MDKWMADRKSIEQWLGTDNQLIEAIDILTDIYNGDYTVKAFRNDVDGYYESDDRGDIDGVCNYCDDDNCTNGECK